MFVTFHHQIQHVGKTVDVAHIEEIGTCYHIWCCICDQTPLSQIPHSAISVFGLCYV